MDHYRFRRNFSESSVKMFQEAWAASRRIFTMAISMEKDGTLLRKKYGVRYLPYLTKKTRNQLRRYSFQPDHYRSPLTHVLVSCCD